MIRFAAIMPFVLALATPVASVAAEPVASADARRVVEALHVKQQIEFLIPKIAPVFGAMVDKVATDRFKAQLAAPDGRDHLRGAFLEEFEKAFRAHVDEMVEAVAYDYDQRLSASDLHAVAEFLSGGAGARWAALLPDLQQTSSSAGARVGALAGEEAYDAVLKRLDPKTGLLK